MDARVTRRFDRRLAGADWSGRVEATFGSAAVVAADRPGLRLTLLENGRAVVPNGICLAPGAALPAIGAPVLLAGRRLDLSGATLLLEREGIDLTVAGLRSWSASTASRQLAALALPQRTRSLLDGSPAHDATDSALLLQAARALDRLCDALCAGAADENDLARAVGELAGLGPGSTPTGDDLLVGATAAANRLAAAKRLPAHTLDHLTAALRALPGDVTTPVGREMLAHAADGRFVEPLPPLVEALGDEDVAAAELDALASRLLTVGSWSGADLLAGVLALVRR